MLIEDPGIYTRSTVGSPSVDNGVGWGGVGWASKLQVRVAHRFRQM